MSLKSKIKRSLCSMNCFKTCVSQDNDLDNSSSAPASCLHSCGNVCNNTERTHDNSTVASIVPDSISTPAPGVNPPLSASIQNLSITPSNFSNDFSNQLSQNNVSKALPSHPITPICYADISINPSNPENTSINPSSQNDASINSSNIIKAPVDTLDTPTPRVSKIPSAAAIAGTTSLRGDGVEWTECTPENYISQSTMGVPQQEVIAKTPSRIYPPVNTNRDIYCNATLPVARLVHRFNPIEEVIDTAASGTGPAPGTRLATKKGRRRLVMPAQEKEKKSTGEDLSPRDMRFSSEARMEAVATVPSADRVSDDGTGQQLPSSGGPTPTTAGSHIGTAPGKIAIVEESDHINSSTVGLPEVLQASPLFRSASVSPRNSYRVKTKPALVLDDKEEDSPNSVDFLSKRYLMSIRGTKVKTSPRHGNSSLSLPNSPQVQKGNVSPPRTVPPRLRTHRRTVSALANVLMTNPTTSKKEHGDVQEAPNHKNTPKGHHKAIIRRLKSLSGGGVIVTEGEESVKNLPTKIHKLDARTVAEELTVLDAEMMRRIKPQELRNGAWTKKDKEQLAPNVMQLIQSFNRLALLTSTEVLAEETPQARAKVISAFIHIADKLNQLQNFNSLKAILSGLQSVSIFRLHKTWSSVSSKRRRIFDNLCDIMSTDDNWKLYRNVLSLALRRPPCVPFLGQFLTDVVQNETAQKALPKRSSEVGKNKELTSTPNAEEDHSPSRGSSEQLKDLISESPVPKPRQPPRLLIVNPQSMRRHSLPISEVNSTVDTPSPSSTSSRWSFEKSDSGVSSHCSFSCPDIFTLTESCVPSFAKLSSRRISVSAKTMYNSPSFVPVYTQYFGGSRSFEDLSQIKSNGKDADDNRGSNVGLALAQFTDMPLASLRGKLMDLELETDTTTTSSRMDSSFSSLEELLSNDEVEIDEDRVFCSREHTPGSSVDLSNACDLHKKTLPEADLDPSDVMVILKEDDDHSSGFEKSNSGLESPLRGRSSRFSSFREKARMSLRGLKLRQRRKAKDAQEENPHLLVSHLDVSEVLETLQISTLGFCGSSGPQVAIRRFLLKAQYNNEDQNYRRSKELEPHDQLP